MPSTRRRSPRTRPCATSSRACGCSRPPTGRTSSRASASFTRPCARARASRKWTSRRATGIAMPSRSSRAKPARRARGGAARRPNGPGAARRRRSAAAADPRCPRPRLLPHRAGAAAARARARLPAPGPAVAAARLGPARATPLYLGAIALCDRRGPRGSRWRCPSRPAPRTRRVVLLAHPRGSCPPPISRSRSSIVSSTRLMGPRRLPKLELAGGVPAPSCAPWSRFRCC